MSKVLYITANPKSVEKSSIMKFIGISDYKRLLVEGHGAMPDKAEDILNKAYAQIPAFVEWFSN